MCSYFVDFYLLNRVFDLSFLSMFALLNLQSESYIYICIAQTNIQRKRHTKQINTEQFFSAT